MVGGVGRMLGPGGLELLLQFVHQQRGDGRVWAGAEELREDCKPSVHIYIYTYIYIRVYMQIYMYVYIYICVYICKNIYVCMYIYVNVCKY